MVADLYFLPLRLEACRQDLTPCHLLLLFPVPHRLALEISQEEIPVLRLKPEIFKSRSMMTFLSQGVTQM